MAHIDGRSVAVLHSIEFKSITRFSGQLGLDDSWVGSIELA